MIARNLMLQHNIEKVVYNYVRLQALVWCSNGLSDPFVTDFKTGEALKSILENNDNKILLINCCYIQRIDDHSLDSFFESLKENKSSVILFNCEAISRDFSNYISNFGVKEKSEINEEIVKIGSTPECNLSLEELNTLSTKIEKEYAVTVVKSTIRENKEINRRLDSTPLYYNGVYDSSVILNDYKKFIWISILMADVARTYRDELLKTTNNIKIISVSLRGSPFASSVALIIGLNFTSIDHLGPKQKLFDIDFLESPQKWVSYIYVGDFTIGGTEIRIARAYAQVSQSTLNHGIVIGSLLSASDYSAFNLKSLLVLNEHFSHIKFGFYKNEIHNDV